MVKTKSKQVRRRQSAAAKSSEFRLPRVHKGKRSQFFSDPGIDQLFAIVTAMTAELSAAFERIATLEALLARGATVSREAVEAFEPDAADAARRAVEREALIARVFQVLELYAGQK